VLNERTKETYAHYTALAYKATPLQIFIIYQSPYK